MKQILFILSIISTVLFAQLEETGFNIVLNNELQTADYGFREFRQDFLVGDRFICIDNFDYWGEDLDFKSIMEIKEIRSDFVTVQSPETGLTITINFENFKIFHESFISGNCLMFSRKFPVKFFKVKTAVGSANEITFTQSPVGESIGNGEAMNVLFYYAYKTKELNGEKYVLLGKTRQFDPDVFEDLDRIIGWVKFKNKENRSENMVLWNTNIGIRPKRFTDDMEPLISKKANSEVITRYYQTNITPQETFLLVSKENIDNYRDRFIKKNAQVNRWLPMYSSNDNKLPEYMARIGVIENLGVIRRDIENIVTMNEIQIALLLDNTASMRPVWKHIHITIEEILKTLTTSKFINAAGDTIMPKIKLYNFCDDINLINRDKWIRTIDDVREYEPVIQAIKPINSKYWRPNIAGSLRQVISDLGDNPLFIIVIGDGGDHTYRNVGFHEIPEFVQSASKNLIILKGVKYNSGLQSAQFKEVLNQFDTNFEVIYDVREPQVTESAAQKIGKEIGTQIIDETENIIIDLKDKILSGKVNTNYKTQSAFTLNYIKSLTNIIQSSSGGTFFEEGNILLRSRSNELLINKDVLVEKSKLATLKNACRDYNHNRTLPQLQIAMRQILATFFEIDFWAVDINFLKTVRLSDFWVRVVGDKDIAEKIAPRLFQQNPSFEHIFDNLEKYQDVLTKNITYIENNITWHFNPPNPGKFSILTNSDENLDMVEAIVEQYYWVDVSELNLFEGIEFEQ
ncbi:MAG: hypothetical protein JXQ65_05950 [Candidatus Marinimicrobia bacterium]|nr:hypothetical protein [Candidatus Neomarinimicrobiota bacterium]